MTRHTGKTVIYAVNRGVALGRKRRWFASIARLVGSLCGGGGRRWLVGSGWLVASLCGGGAWSLLMLGRLRKSSACTLSLGLNSFTVLQVLQGISHLYTYLRFQCFLPVLFLWYWCRAAVVGVFLGFQLLGDRWAVETASSSSCWCKLKGELHSFFVYRWTFTRRVTSGLSVFLYGDCFWVGGGWFSCSCSIFGALSSFLGLWAGHFFLIIA